MGLRIRALTPVSMRLLQQRFEHRQEEGQRFAGAGLRGGDDVASFERRRNRFRLHGRGSYKAILGKVRLQNGGTGNSEKVFIQSFGGKNQRALQGEQRQERRVADLLSIRHSIARRNKSPFVPSWFAEGCRAARATICFEKGSTCCEF